MGFNLTSSVRTHVWRQAVPGHELPVVVPAGQPFERLLQSETCRTAYACNSAKVAFADLLGMVSFVPDADLQYGDYEDLQQPM